MQAIILDKVGDSLQFKAAKVKDPKPKKNEVVVKHKAIGVNFFDVAFRRGQYKLAKTPAIIGMEACGIVESVGEGVTDFEVGERVAHATAGMGSYCERKAVNKHHLVAVPEGISDVQAAAVLHKGLMAHALLHRVYTATRAKKILVQAAAGGVGHLLCQWAKYLGVEVIGTVGSDSKVAFAQQSGCSHVINYKTQDLVEELEKITDNGGVGLVYDGVGKDTLKKSLECLWPMGMCVSYGEASGNTEALDLNLLVANSLYITRPTLALYKANRIELAMSASEVFAAVKKGILKPKINSYHLKDVKKAHADIENRSLMGSTVLTL